MRGTVTLWIENRDAPMKSWGCITPEGGNRNRKDETVYCNSKSVRYSPVVAGM